MGQVCWPADAAGKYWMDVVLDRFPTRVMVDTGLIDRHNWVGFDLAPAVYGQLKTAGTFAHIAQRKWRDAAGHVSVTECGLLAAQLLNAAGQRVGPVARIYVNRGFPQVPARVGLAFFHHLTGCRVLWELDQRLWCIEYP
jgi:hypothetical protein